MKPAALERHQHPIYIWLNKPREYNDILKFKDLLPQLKEKPLSKPDTLLLIAHINFYLNALLEPYTTRCYSIDNNLSSSEKSPLNALLSAYQTLFLFDEKQKSAIWDPRVVSQLDQFPGMQKFFDENFPHIIKQSSYRNESIKLIQKVWLEERNYISEYKKFDKHTQNFIEMFDRYKLEPNWSQVITKNPGIFNAQLATHYNYELKSTELIAVFNNMQNHFRGYSHIFQNDVEPLAEMFVELFRNSKFFKHTIAPAKDVHHSIAKFLKTSIKNDPLSYVDKFTNAVIEHTGYSYINLEHKLQKNTNIKIMGKPFLKPEEQEECNKVFQATKNPEKKRNKI